MKPIRLFPLSDEALIELDDLYRTTRDVRIRTRTQMILLSAEKQMVPNEIASIVRRDEQTVRRWLKRYQAEGLNGLYDRSRPGSPGKVTSAYQEPLVTTVRQRPRSLGQPYSLWTLQRLADYMAEQTGIRISDEAVRVHLKAATSYSVVRSTRSVAQTLSTR
jgi:transposase